MKLQDAFVPCASESKADTSNLLSIDLAVEEEIAQPKQTSSGALPEWKWWISAINTDKIKRKSIRSEPGFRKFLVASKTNENAPGLNLSLEDLLRALGLWNTDLFDDNDDDDRRQKDKSPSCTILINNLSTVLNRILAHPLIVKARKEWDLGKRAEELMLPVELHSLVNLFSQIWVPERESRSIFGSLYQDSYVGPELKRLFSVPRPYPVAVGFYVGNPVPNHQPVRYRTPTADEENQWTRRIVKSSPVFAFNVHVLRQNGGQSVDGAGFRPGLFKIVFEIDPDLEDPDGRPVTLFAPLVNPLKALPPRPAPHHWTGWTPPPTIREPIDRILENSCPNNKPVGDFDWINQPRVTSKTSREPPSSAAKHTRYSLRSTRSRMASKDGSMTSAAPSRVVSREVRPRTGLVIIDDDEDEDEE